MPKSVTATSSDPEALLQAAFDESKGKFSRAKPYDQAILEQRLVGIYNAALQQMASMRRSGTSEGPLKAFAKESVEKMNRTVTQFYVTKREGDEEFAVLRHRMDDQRRDITLLPGLSPAVGSSHMDLPSFGKVVGEATMNTAVCHTAHVVQHYLGHRAAFATEFVGHTFLHDGLHDGEIAHSLKHGGAEAVIGTVVGRVIEGPVGYLIAPAFKVAAHPAKKVEELTTEFLAQPRRALKLSPDVDGEYLKPAEAVRIARTGARFVRRVDEGFDQLHHLIVEAIEVVPKLPGMAAEKVLERYPAEDHENVLSCMDGGCMTPAQNAAAISPPQPTN